MEVGKLNETDLWRGNSLEVLEGVRRRMAFVTSRSWTIVIRVVGRAVIGQVGTQAIKINKDSFISKLYAWELSLKLAGPHKDKNSVKRQTATRK